MPISSSAARRTRAAADPSLPPPPDLYAGGPFANPPAANNRQSASSSPPGPASNAPTRRGGDDAGGNLGFEVRGFATDPKHSGYQILTNYESTYWRAFVGVQAWSLYEVLRSFCHNGNNVCYPSINYLLEVLGIKQRRVLTGWRTEVKGKQYDYPGLIETLQTSGLVIAEVVGEGPMLRYLFHVNLTPDLLAPEQVAQLPALLQTKHAEMLESHFAEMAEIASRRRPAKNANSVAPPPLPVQQDTNSTKNMVEKGGMTNCQTGVTNCHTGGDKLSHKQHQSNNTQLTTAPTTNTINNNSGDLQQKLLGENTPAELATPLDPESTDVVVALTNLGLADNVVKRLTTRFNRKRILEKIDYLAYLEEFHPNKVKNPRGWLRRAIEENYGAPDGYLSPEQRAARRDAPNDPPRIRYSSFEVRHDDRDNDRDDNGSNDRSDVRDAGTRDGPKAAFAPGIDSGYGAGFVADFDADFEVDVDGPLFSLQPQAAAEREYVTAARRELIRRLHAPPPDALAFWEVVRNDVHATMSTDYYELIAASSILSMNDSTITVAIWDREHYRQLLHPNRIKALERNMSTLTKRKMTLICEFWDEEGQVVPPGSPPPA